MSSVQSSVKRQVGHAQTVAEQAVTSTAWLYPIRGILYLMAHPNLIKPVLPVFLKGVVLSLGVVAALFFFLYLPHVAVLAFISGPLAFIAAVPLILGEAYIVILWLSRPLLGQLETDLFDLVLAQHGHQDLVKRGRQAASGQGSTFKLGRLVGNPFAKFSIDSAVRYVFTLPLNFIPVVGTACFLIINGYKSGPGYHARYFQLKGFTKDQKAAAINKRRGAYTAFGVASLVLNLIPAVSVLFTCTNAIGAALWASDVEKGAVQKNSRDEL